MNAEHDEKSERAEKRLSVETQRRANSARHAKSRQLAQRIQLLLEQRGWTQSELGRRAGLNRDVIHKTMSGFSFPSLESTRAMARAFGVQVTDLTDAFEESAAVRDLGRTDVPFGMQELPSKPGRIWLTVNKEVSANTAAQIHMLLLNDAAAD